MVPAVQAEGTHAVEVQIPGNRRETRIQTTVARDYRFIVADVALAAALETGTSSLTEVVQTMTELEQQGMMEIVQLASNWSSSVSSSTAVVQTFSLGDCFGIVQSVTESAEETVSSTEVAQTVVQESISSLMKLPKVRLRSVHNQLPILRNGDSGCLHWTECVDF